MRDFARFSILPFLLTLTICVVVSAVGLEKIEAWQTLIAGVLALIGAAGVLLAAHWEVSEIRSIAGREVRQQRRAARMRITTEMESLFDACEKIVMDLGNWRRSNHTMGKRHIKIPAPVFVSDTSIAYLPEAEDLLRFVRNIRIVNENTVVYEAVNPQEAESYLMTEAAACAVRAFVWRHLLAKMIGWRPMGIHHDRIETLRLTATTGDHRVDLASLPDTE